MDRLSPIEFSSSIASLCNKYDFIIDYELKIEENVIVKCRIFLIDDSFVEVYYNFENGKTSFALIKGNCRIFGADNLGFWHIHPFESPEKHIRSGEIKIEDFIKRIKNNLFK